MKVLVTGATGFIGFNLILNLLKFNQYQIDGVDNLNSYYDIKLKKDRLTILEGSKKRFKFYKLNICNKKKINNLFKKNNYDIVVHLAAQAGVRYSLIDPKTYLKNNIDGFYNIIENSKNFKIKNFIYASTSSVYGNSKKFPLKEEYNTNNPESFYAATKKNNEIIASSYSSLYDIKTIGLRFFTVYGPFGRPDMAHYKFTNAIINKKSILLFNNGNHYRDFTYIDDVTTMISKIISNVNKIKPKINIFNIGSGETVSLMKLISLLEREIGKKALLEFVEMQKGDVYKTHSNIDNISEIIKFKPKININEGVKLYLKWFLKYYS